MEKSIVARYVGTGMAEPPIGQLKDVDHGVPP